MRHINNVRELRQALADGKREFKIHLCGGAVYSSKYITPCSDGRFGVLNYFNGSIERLTASELVTHSNIGRAMRQKAFTTEEDVF